MKYRIDSLLSHPHQHLMTGPDLRAVFKSHQGSEALAITSRLNELSDDNDAKAKLLGDYSLELERLQASLAACGVGALRNTRESASKQRLNKDHRYFSESLKEVYRAVDREMDLRENIEKIDKPLVDLFRTSEFSTYGQIGDANCWSPSQTAVFALKGLKDQVAALEAKMDSMRKGSSESCATEILKAQGGLFGPMPSATHVSWSVEPDGRFTFTASRVPDSIYANEGECGFSADTQEDLVKAFAGVGAGIPTETSDSVKIGTPEEIESGLTSPFKESNGRVYINDGTLSDATIHKTKVSDLPSTRVLQQRIDRRDTRIKNLIEIILRCQKALAAYFEPDGGVKKGEVINALLEILESPRTIRMAKPIVKDRVLTENLNDWENATHQITFDGGLHWTNVIFDCGYYIACSDGKRHWDSTHFPADRVVKRPE